MLIRFSVLVLTAFAVPGLGQASQASDVCNPSQVRLSISRISNSFTGGSYPLFVNLRNVSTSECSVEGHPLVVVSPHRFPVVVGDLADFDRNNPYIGPERLLQVRPGRRVRAYVVIGRLCAGAKSEMTSGTITFSSYRKRVSLKIRACRREGAEVDTGPFLPAP
jgi:hypothetical protein